MFFLSVDWWSTSFPYVSLAITVYFVDGDVSCGRAVVAHVVETFFCSHPFAFYQFLECVVCWHDYLEFGFPFQCVFNVCRLMSSIRVVL